MSWQAASLAIVVASLAGCFWWYERSRPSSKELALVAQKSLDDQERHLTQVRGFVEVGTQYSEPQLFWVA